MILQALARYYDILSRDPDIDIAPPGYSSVGVSFALNISGKGELLDVLLLFEKEQRGNKIVEWPRRMIVPEQVKKTSGISANFLCENSAYILGISGKGDDSYGQVRYSEFARHNRGILNEVNNETSKAVIAFFDNYKPESASSNPTITPHLEAILKGGNLVFMFNGKFVHEDNAIKKAWEKYKGSSDSNLIQCLVSGEIAPLARLHPSLKGIRDSNPTGATLVGFNARAYESYNREQGMNSPVGEKFAFAYTTTLNYLLSSSNENKKFFLGDSTVVYWAESDKKEYAKAFWALCEPEEIEIVEKIEVVIEGEKAVRDKKAEKTLKKVAEKVKRVQALDTKKLLEGLDDNPRFYVLGLAPNAARISVRFFHSDPFNKVVEKIMQHYNDLKIVKEYENQHTYLTIQDILRETVSQKSTDKNASPLLAGSLFRSILEGSPYPAALYNAIINRIRADQDETNSSSKKIKYERAAIIKAYLLRKYRNKSKLKDNQEIKEVLVMSLNEGSSIPAYLLGRLFAVLEKIQQEAIGNVNASIKDRYFTSACATPGSVFPILLRLSQHHISKAEAYYHDKLIEEILSKLDIVTNPIPAHLTLDEQGVFILGYYHQRKSLWTSRKTADSNLAESN